MFVINRVDCFHNCSVRGAHQLDAVVPGNSNQIPGWRERRSTPMYENDEVCCPSAVRIRRPSNNLTISITSLMGDQEIESGTGKGPKTRRPDSVSRISAASPTTKTV